MQRIKVSENKRHFVTATGDPFFWLADTAWELLHKLTLEEASHYLSVRASQGFTVVQAVVLAELNGINSTNARGDLPLLDKDPEQPNEAYFRHVDDIILAAASHDLYMALLPTWGDKVSKRYEWAVGPELFNEQNARSYAHWLASRYKNENNIIWVLGGDRNPDDREKAVWSAMAKGIKEVDETALISFHPQPFDGQSSSTWFHDADWLSFNMLQTGHNKYTPVHELIAKDYAMRPVKPVLNGEPTYETHPLSFKVSEGYSTEVEIRRDAYLSVFAGACGHTYGCHSIWQFHRTDDKGVNYPIMEWKEALHLAGASQMKYLYRLIMDHAPLERIPGNDVLVSGDLGEIRDTIIATRAADGSYAFVYTASGKKIIVRTAVLDGGYLQSYWLNPRNGTITIHEVLRREPQMEYKPPNSGEGCDWVLIIEVIN